ncbi:MAG: hypothetical protein LBR05_00080 [Azoarcus sp.]|jgi:hypothetical protein|nr:hypothetical protein [Azoarcus sp.]
MSRLLRVIQLIPLPTVTKLNWQRLLLHYTFASDISVAQKAGDIEKVQNLKNALAYENYMLDEKESIYFSRRLIKKARSLRVPVPSYMDEDGFESEHWCIGRLREYYLTNYGFDSLREKIRTEQKARHEIRAQWIRWVSALTGLVGAITALIALFGYKVL